MENISIWQIVFTVINIFVLAFVIYAIYLLIKALRKYIKKIVC